MDSASQGTFYQVLTAALDDFLEHGFDSQQRLDEWLRRLAAAAHGSLISEAVLTRTLRDALTRVYTRTVERGGLLRRHKGISEFRLAQIRPSLRAELDRRIVAAAHLIKLNRSASIQRTLQRFAGWATSIPAGRTEAGKRQEARQTVRRGIAALPFEERRVVVDQGHKLSAALNDLIAVAGGAIIAEWLHVKEAGYNARPEHEARDGELFVIRNNWALQKGLMKLDGHAYTDEIEQPAELPFCRCTYRYRHNLRDVPDSMLTAKGRGELKRVRAAITRMSHASHV